MKEHRLSFSEDLDRIGCTIPGCDHTTHDEEIHFHSRCHPDVPAWISYRAGVLAVSCAECGSHVAAIAVAPRSQRPPRRR